MIPSTVDDFRKLENHYVTRFDEADLELPPETSARIGLALCELILDTLTPSQRWAVSQARLHWSGQPAPGLDEALSICIGEINSSFEKPLSSDARARSRLTFSSVNTCTPFDGTASGYLITLGRDAGVQFSDMVEILERYAGDTV